MSESSNNSDDTIIMSQEAESTQDSPEIEQDGPQSPDSTVQEGGLHLQPSTSSDRLMHSTDENRNIADVNLSNLGSISENSAANEIVINQGERSTTSAPRSSADEINILRENQPKLFGLLTRDSDIETDLINQTEQSSTSGHMPKPGTSESTCSRQVVKQRKQCSDSRHIAQPNLSIARSSTSPDEIVEPNTLLTNRITVNPAANENFINQTQQSSASGQMPQTSASNTRPTSRPAQSHQVIEQEKQSFASTQIAQPSFSTAISASSSPLPGSKVEGNPLLTNILMVNPAVNENLINKGRQSTAIGPIPQSSTPTRPTARPTQARQVVIQGEQSYISSHVAQPNLSIARSSTRSGETVQSNRLIGNMITGNPAANENLINQRQQSSTSGQMSQSSASNTKPKFRPAQPYQLIKQGKQSSASRQIAQPSLSTARSASSSPQPGNTVEKSPLLTNMLMVNPAINENLINKGRRRTASAPIPQSSTPTRPTARPTQARQVQGEQSSTSRHVAQPNLSIERSSTSPVETVESNLLFRNMITVNPAANENLINQRQQSYASGQMPQPSASNTRPTSRPAQPHQVIKEGEQSSASRQIAQPSLSTARSASSPGKKVKENLLLTNMFSGNSAANENLLNQGEQSSASGQRTLSSAYSERTSSLPAQLCHVNTHGGKSSSRLPQPSTSTARSASSPTQSADSVEGNLLLTNMLIVNPADNETLINRQRSISAPIPQSSASTTRPTSRPAQSRQVVKRESSASRQVEQPGYFTARRAPRPGELVKANPMLMNMITVNPAANENLINRGTQSSASSLIPQSIASTTRPTSSPAGHRQVVQQGEKSSSRLPSFSTAFGAYSPAQRGGRGEGNPLFTNMLTVNPGVNENVIDLGRQSGASKPVAQSRASTATLSSSAQPHQVVKLEEQISASRLMEQASLSTESASSPRKIVTDNSFLKNMFSGNSAANENLLNKGEQSFASKLGAPSRAYTERTSSRPAQPRHVYKQAEQSSVSRLQQPSTTTARSTTSPTQSGDRVEGNPLLTNVFMVNPAINENLINRGRPSRPKALSRVSTESLSSCSSQPRQIVKQEEQSSASRLMAQPSLSTESASSHLKIVEDNPLLTNIFPRNSASNVNLLNQGEQSSASEHIAQPSTRSSRNTSALAQSYQVFEQNQMLTNMDIHANINELLTNRGESSLSSGQILLDNPSRRKREGEAPDPQPSCSPTKKKKSPSKKK